MDQLTTAPHRTAPDQSAAHHGACQDDDGRRGARGRSSLRCRTTMGAATAPSAADQLRAEFLHVLQSRRLNPDGKCVFFSPQGFSYLTRLISGEFVPWFDCWETCTRYCKIFGLTISLPFCRIVSVQFRPPFGLGER